MCGRLSRPPDVLVKIEEARLRVRTSSEFIRIAVREWNDSTLGFGPGSAAQSPFMESRYASPMRSVECAFASGGPEGTSDGELA